MPMIRSTSENRPKHLLPMNERSVNNKVSAIHDLILDETLDLAWSARTWFNVTTSAQSSITSFSAQYKTSPPEKKRQQQSVRYLLSLSLTHSRVAVPSTCPQRHGLGLCCARWRERPSWASPRYFSYRKTWFSQARWLSSRTDRPLISTRNTDTRLEKLSSAYSCFCVEKGAFPTWHCELMCAR